MYVYMYNMLGGHITNLNPIPHVLVGYMYIDNGTFKNWVFFSSVYTNTQIYAYMYMYIYSLLSPLCITYMYMYIYTHQYQLTDEWNGSFSHHIL